MQKTRKKTRPGQSDIASALGVSVSTVSRALADSPAINDDIKHQVQQVARQIGYPVRQAPRVEAFERISLITSIGALNDSRSSIYASMINGIRAAAAPVCARIESSITRSRTLHDQPLDGSFGPRSGVIFLGLVPSPEVAADIAARGIPAVVSNGVDQDYRIDSIAPANFGGARLMGRHLTGLGHRDFLYLQGIGRATLRRRLDGFRQHVEAEGGHIVGVFDDGSSLNEETFERFTAWLKAERGDATALFCFNDGAAAWALEATRAAGLSVPDDLSVVGFDDMPIASMTTPPLTTFRIDWDALGEQTVELLHQRLREPQRPVQFVQVGGTLIERESVQRLQRVPDPA
ncbi:substrate-binding domain-containing protein [Rhodobacteraceae bacterium 2CG4]|uniref:Substrate-binding domain-containing protein n=1 Tax=Halovulum marinum TaxID=2662447 RepID=A0A6L5YWK5_9RHOB|nr:LacI family DNA-binding transcriptional regulator [Halovulum marinum]MSU88014.1 substrate-binding domain-containing protein [Halovulum marinum]